MSVPAYSSTARSRRRPDAESIRRRAGGLCSSPSLRASTPSNRCCYQQYLGQLGAVAEPARVRHLRAADGLCTERTAPISPTMCRQQDRRLLLLRRPRPSDPHPRTGLRASTSLRRKSPDGGDQRLTCLATAVVLYRNRAISVVTSYWLAIWSRVARRRAALRMSGRGSNRVPPNAVASSSSAGFARSEGHAVDLSNVGRGRA
jgi:hypothetical protein